MLLLWTVFLMNLDEELLPHGYQISSVEESYDSNGNKKVPFSTKFHIPETEKEDLEEDTPSFVQKG